MRKTGYNTLTALLLVLLTLYSCRKESTYWEADYVAPLAHGSLPLGTMFPDTTIKSNPDSTLKIAFDTEVINFGIDSLLKIPDTTITNVTTIPFSFSVTPGSSIFQNTTTTYYDLPNGILLRNAIVKYGKVKVELSNTTRLPLLYHYKLLPALKNGVMLDTTFTIPQGVHTGTVCVAPGTTTCYINLAGYNIDFTGSTHNTNNTLDQFGEIIISPNAQPDSIFATQGLTSNFTFTGIVPEYAQGYFGNQNVSVGPDTTSFTVFNTIQSGMLDLNSADVQLKIVNEFGVSMKATIGNLTALSTPNATTTVLTSTVVNSSYIINAAVNNGLGAPVTAATKTLTLNNSNSNVKDFIGILPDKFIYQLNTQLNPYGNLGGNNDFAYYGTGFKAYLSADIPLYFAANNIKLADTVPFSFSDVKQFDNVNRGQLILTATNSYPFSINLQGYLLDENKNVIDVLFASPSLVQAPPLDANNKVIAPLQSKLTIPINQAKIQNLKKAKYVYYSATFNTASQPAQIKFYNYYTLDLLLTADINYTVGK